MNYECPLHRLAHRRRAVKDLPLSLSLLRRLHRRRKSCRTTKQAEKRLSKQATASAVAPRLAQGKRERRGTQKKDQLGIETAVSESTRRRKSNEERMKDKAETKKKQGREQ